MYIHYSVYTIYSTDNRTLCTLHIGGRMNIQNEVTMNYKIYTLYVVHAVRYTPYYVRRALYNVHYTADII